MLEQRTIESYSQMLSREGIRVNYSPDARTASFNMKDRTIKLPMYSYLGATECQLLTSHEVGHALFSKYDPDSFVEYGRKYGCLFNIVEDIFIESEIKKEYPGLREVFKDGYTSLNKENFFGIDPEKVDTYSFLDRLNLFFKIGHCIKVPFSQEESEIIVDCYNLQSNDDVLAMCDRILEFQKEQKNQEQEGQDQEESTMSSCENEQEQEEQEEQEGYESEQEYEEEEEEWEEELEGDQTQEGFTYKNFEESVSSELEEKQEKNNTNSDSETFVDTDIVLDLNNIPESECVIDYTNETKFIVNAVKRFPNSRFNQRMQEDLEKLRSLGNEGDAYFKMLKNAKRAKDVKLRNTGRIDTRRLAKYKTTETIFKKRIIQSKETNHGIVIMLDYSGSMNQQIKDVISQAILVCEFCKRNNIKFEIYLFGATINSPNYMNCPNVVYKITDQTTYTPEMLYVYSVNARDYSPHFEQSLNKELYDLLKDKFYLYMSQTPMATATVASYYAIKRMKMANVDKTHLIFITDGLPTDTDIKASFTNACNHGPETMREFSNGNNHHVFVDGIAYPVLPYTLYIYASIAAMFSHIKLMFGTDITLSYINPGTIKKTRKGEHISGFTTEKSMEGYSLFSKYAMPHMAEFMDLHQQIQVFSLGTGFADNIILYNKRLDLEKQVNINTVNGVQKHLALESEKNKALSIFVKELAKKIA